MVTSPSHQACSDATSIRQKVSAVKYQNGDSWGPQLLVGEGQAHGRVSRQGISRAHPVERGTGLRPLEELGRRGKELAEQSKPGAPAAGGFSEPWSCRGLPRLEAGLEAGAA